jgi:hypothetical protein
MLRKDSFPVRFAGLCRVEDQIGCRDERYVWVLKVTLVNKCDSISRWSSYFPGHSDLSLPQRQ